MNEDYGIDDYYAEQFEVMRDEGYDDFIAEQQCEEFYEDTFEDILIDEGYAELF